MTTHQQIALPLHHIANSQPIRPQTRLDPLIERRYIGPLQPEQERDGTAVQVPGVGR